MIETVKAFTALSEEFVELFMKHHPVMATESGIHDYDHLLPDDSPDGVRERAAWLRDLEQRLVASVPWDELPIESRVDFALLRSRIATLRADLEEIHVPQKTPTLFLMRAFRGVHLLLARSFAPLDERKESAVARLMAIPDYFEGACESLGAVPPELLTAGLELAGRGPGFVDDVVRRLMRQFPGESERLEHAGSRARTGFLRLHEHLETLRTEGRGAGESFAIGERWMNYRLDREHLAGMIALDVEEMARERIANATRQLEEEARRADPRRNWRELVADGRERRPEAGWLREAYAAEIDRAKRFVTERRLMPLPEGERLEVIETPLYSRDFSPQACYLGPAPFDHDAVGLFQLTPVDPRKDKDTQARQLAGHCTAVVPIVALRETYPGLHVMLARAAGAGTRLRRMARNDAMSGGWVAYAEEWMADEGFLNSDPLSMVFARLASLRRATLALVDSSLHCGRMTPAEAQALLAEETLLEPDAAAAAVRECCVAPTRAASALVGAASLVALREEARAKLGAAYDSAAFHGAVCDGGVLPPTLVREEIWERLDVA
jgi:hypothetical protein